MSPPTVFLFCLAGIGLLTASVPAQFKTRLKPETGQAFEEYVSRFEKNQPPAGEDFLWIDGRPESVRVRARNGEIVLHHYKVDIKVPDGMIHDWLGSVFIPGADAGEVVSLIRNYDIHAKHYAEAVDSRLIENKENTVRGFHRLRKKKVLTVVLNAEFLMKIHAFEDGRWYIPCVSTRITEIADPGKPTEKELPVGEGRGFLWRLNSYWFIEQAEDGVWAECRSISLSRDIPWVLGWIIRPFVESTPRETLISVLGTTRDLCAK